MTTTMPKVVLGTTELQLQKPANPLALTQIRQSALVAPVYGGVAALGFCLPPLEDSTAAKAPVLMPFAAFQHHVGRYAEHVMEQLLDQGIPHIEIQAAGMVALAAIRDDELLESEVASATGFFGRKQEASTEH